MTYLDYVVVCAAGVSVTNLCLLISSRAKNKAKMGAIERTLSLTQSYARTAADMSDETLSRVNDCVAEQSRAGERFQTFQKEVRDAAVTVGSAPNAQSGGGDC